MYDDSTPNYPSILNVWKRDPETRHRSLIPWGWSTLELELLAGIKWTFTEKIDGTNIKVILESDCRPKFRGRTSKAVIPRFLYDTLVRLFPDDSSRIVRDYSTLVLFGEGYGKRIQGSGEKYIKDGVSFILFDVLSIPLVGSPIWLERDSVENIANQLNIQAVPIIGTGTLYDAIVAVKHGLVSIVAEQPETRAEGIVAKPQRTLLDRVGNRVVCKIKTVDFYKEA